MDNKLIKYTPNLITRIKDFFKNIFSKDKRVKNENNINNVRLGNDSRKEFIAAIKQEDDFSSQVIKRRNNIQKIEEDEENLKSLSTAELIEISKYYDEIIEKNNKIIERLKKLA